MRRLIVQSIAAAVLGTMFTPVMWAATDLGRDHTVLDAALWAVQL